MRHPHSVDRLACPEDALIERGYHFMHDFSGRFAHAARIGNNFFYAFAHTRNIQNHGAEDNAASRRTSPAMPNTLDDDKRISALRMLSIDMVQRANSGHPGMPLGAAAQAYTIWTKHLRRNPADPMWFDRDRFVLSAGHASALLYALLYLNGDLTLDDLKGFRQWGSR